MNPLRDDETTALSVGFSIGELVAVYEKAEADIRAGFASVGGALAALNGAFALASWRDVDLRTRNNHRGFQPDEIEDYLIELRRQIWSALIERAQVRKAMSIAAWSTLEKQIKEGEPPPITAENVVGMLAKFRHDVPEMLKAAVDEVFAFLRPPSSRFATNTEFEIGERVVLSGYVSRGYGRNWDVNHWRDQHLTALDNVFGVLEGKIRTESHGYYGALALAIKACPLSGPCHGETDYFEFRGFKNTNLHLRFKRMDLVAKLNAVAGGARLKPATDGAP